MNVRYLKSLLEELPDDYTVTIGNDHVHIRGEYEATRVYVNKKQKTVEIESNCQHRFTNERNRKNYDDRA